MVIYRLRRRRFVACLLISAVVCFIVVYFAPFLIPITYPGYYDFQFTRRFTRLPSSDSVVFEGNQQRLARAHSYRLQSHTWIKMSNIYDNLSFDNTYGGVWTQGWNVTYDRHEVTRGPPLYVYVVPHSHNDPGWIRTYENYYRFQSKRILDSLVSALTTHAQMKFIWAEISFLHLWWMDANDSQRNSFLNLVQDGRIELVNGGWVMPDEANTDIYSLLQQLSTGLEWIRSVLGPNVAVRNGWAIDPFGLSPTQAHVLKLASFDNVVIQRAHYSVKREFARRKYLEFYWRQSFDYSGSTDIFCHLMPFYSYDIPHTCGPNPKVCCQFDFARLKHLRKYYCDWGINPVNISSLNIVERSRTLVDQYRKKSQLFSTNVLLVPLGDDFRYDSVNEIYAQYTNYLNIFNYVNNATELNTKIQFGTLDDYFRKLHATSSGGNFPILTGDFFTYSDKNDEYWSGYYTTRPFYKQLDRSLVQYLRSAEILYSLVRLRLNRNTLSASTQQQQQQKLLQLVERACFVRLVQSRQLHALFQHHDGVTGTSKSYVMSDYSSKLHRAISNCQHILSVLSSVLVISPSSRLLAPTARDTLHENFAHNEIYHSHTQLPANYLLETATTVLIFNSQLHTRYELIRLQVTVPYVEVTDTNGHTLDSECFPVVYFDRHLSVHKDRHWLLFVAPLPALSLTRFHIQFLDERSTNDKHSLAEILTEIPSIPIPHVYRRELVPRDSGQFVVESNVLRVKFDSHGFLASIGYHNDVWMNVSLEFVKYGAAPGSIRSGAYIFRPDGPPRNLAPESDAQGYVYSRGRLVSYVSACNKFVHHTVRVSHHTDMLDSEWLDISNTIHLRSCFNCEIAMRINSPIRSGDVFYTDLNGFQITKRKRYSKLPIQANFYPMSKVIYIEDTDYRISLVSAQPLGSSSQAAGQLEILLDRTLAQDDLRGVFQNVVDNRPTVSRFRLVLERFSVQRTLNQPSVSPLVHLAHSSLLHPSPVMLLNTSRAITRDDVGAYTGRGAAPHHARVVSPCSVDLLMSRWATILQPKSPAADASSTSTASTFDYQSANHTILVFARSSLDLRLFSVHSQFHIEQMCGESQIELGSVFADQSHTSLSNSDLRGSITAENLSFTDPLDLSVQTYIYKLML